MVQTVITYGTFDLFHVGHLRLLQRCRSLGTRLVVGCSTDEFNTIKGKSSVVRYEHRAEILRGCRYVDEVFPEHNWDQKPNDIQKWNADVFVMGDDWVGHFDHLSALCTVTYLSRTQDISTTDLKRYMGLIQDERINAIKHAIVNLSHQIDQL